MKNLYLRIYLTVVVALLLFAFFSAFNVLEAILHTVAEEGRTVLFSSHLLDEVERMSDQLALIDGGRILLTGGLDKIRERHWRITVRAGGTPSGERTLIREGDREALAAEFERSGNECVAISPASLDEIFFARTSDAELLADLRAVFYGSELEPVVVNAEVGAEREVLVYERINDAVRAVLLPSSRGADLDQLVLRGIPLVDVYVRPVGVEHLVARIDQLDQHLLALVGHDEVDVGDRVQAGRVGARVRSAGEHEAVRIDLLGDARDDRELVRLAAEAADADHVGPEDLQPVADGLVGLRLLGEGRHVEQLDAHDRRGQRHHPADRDPRGQRKLDQHRPSRVADDHPPGGPLVDEVLHTLHEIAARDLDLFGPLSFGHRSSRDGLRRRAGR